MLFSKFTGLVAILLFISLTIICIVDLRLVYRVSQKNCSTFYKILKNKDNVNKLMER